MHHQHGAQPMLMAELVVLAESIVLVEHSARCW